MSKVMRGIVIHDLVKSSPEALRVLAKHSIDICCGGHLSIEEGAVKAGVDVDAVLQELNTVSKGRSATSPSKELVANPDVEEVKCHMCGKTDHEAAILRIRFHGREEWLCTRCLPYLIHSE